MVNKRASLYNLYLLDDTHDANVIRRLARVTGLREAQVRHGLRSLPFLVVRERALGDAVALRRELESQGLSLRLEWLSADRVTGDTRHPLADLDVPDEEVASGDTGRVEEEAEEVQVQRKRPGRRGAARGTQRRDAAEIILEEGSGFRQVQRPWRSARGAEEEPEKSSFRMWWLLIAAAVVAGLVSGMLLMRSCTPKDPALQKNQAWIKNELARIEPQLRHLLTVQSPPPEVLDPLLLQLSQVREQAQSDWNLLPESLRHRIENLESICATLELRRPQGSVEPEATPQPETPDVIQPVGPLDAFRHEPLDSLSFKNSLRQAMASNRIPVSLSRQRALERLVDQAEELRRDRSTAFNRRLDEQLKTQSAQYTQMKARMMAGALRHRGLQWLPVGSGPVAVAGLPDNTQLELKDAHGEEHRAEVRGGLVHLVGRPNDLNPVSARLAALQEQPNTVRRLLEAGLRLYNPEVYYATIPGSTLPRPNPEEIYAHAVGRLPSELMREAVREGRIPETRVEGSPLDPELRVSQAAGSGELLRVLDRCAESYIRCRQWPRKLLVQQGETEYAITGQDLWLLTARSSQ